MHRIRLAALLVCSAYAVPAAAGFSQLQKITSTPRGVGAQFGNAVATSGNTMVVGARFDATTANQAGAAFVFVLSGTTWTQQARLLASDGAISDKFGYSVAIDADTIVVGAYNDDSPLSNAGSAYVFVRSGTTWTQQQKLTAGDATADDEFGVSVAVSGNTAVVGAHFADLPGNSAAGAAYRFARSGTVWTQTQKLVPSGGVILGDSFGESLAIGGNRLAVGSSTADIPQTGAGSVYVYVDSGASYSLQQKLSIAGGTNGDIFGCSVAIEGNTLVGGAREDTPIVGQPAYGAAYVFEYNGATWSEQQKLTASDGATFDRFGWSVAIGNGVVAVGAREDDSAVGLDSGSAYVFTRSGTVWTQQQKIVPLDTFNSDRFGASVAWNSGKLVVGASEKALSSPNGQGAVYVFTSVPPVFPDFDGDGKADISLFRPSDSTWRVIRSSDGSNVTTPFGLPGDLMAPGDFDGDRKTDPAVFRSGTWLVLQSSNGQTTSHALGTSGDWPIPGDYDGDGISDFSVFRPSTGEWIRINSSNAQMVTTSWGATGDNPLIGDFDGDGKSDLSVYRPSSGYWFVLRSSDSATVSTSWGFGGDIPAPADYDGDDTTDHAVFRPAGATWFLLQSTLGYVSQVWGMPGDTPASADFDGDGSEDIGVFRPSNGTWYLSRSSLGSQTQPFGVAGDLPVPLFFIRQIQSGAGRVPGDHAFEYKLSVVRSGNNISLAWGGTCLFSDNDFSVYQGTLGNFTSHTPVACSTSGATTLTFAPASGNRYYLVVPHNGTKEGSYGNTSAGAQRAPSASACHPQTIGGCP